jgi:hypothetical protein
VNPPQHIEVCCTTVLFNIGHTMPQV